MENLQNIIESLLFASGDEIAISDICDKFDVSKGQIDKTIKELKNKYSAECGIHLLQFNNKLQFSTNPNYTEAISLVLNPIKQRNLTKATMETASIIAYKQPITRAEIEEVRGVGCDYAINVLLEHKLIEIVGRKETVGRPALFGTTDEFLKRFDIASIDDLPDYNAMLQGIQEINAKSTDDSLFNFAAQEQTNAEVEEKISNILKENVETTDADLQETVDSNESDYDDML